MTFAEFWLVYGRKQTDRHTYIHTTSANAVTLVWGLLRLVQITLASFPGHCSHAGEWEREVPIVYDIPSSLGSLAHCSATLKSWSISVYLLKGFTAGLYFL